jgi:hypothetical protein
MSLFLFKTFRLLGPNWFNLGIFSFLKILNGDGAYLNYLVQLLKHAHIRAHQLLVLLLFILGDCSVDRVSDPGIVGWDFHVNFGFCVVDASVVVHLVEVGAVQISYSHWLTGGWIRCLF